MKTHTKRRGRPPKSSGAKTEAILLRMELREKVAFEMSAELAGAPLSVWIRERLRKAAIRELEEANKAVPFLESQI